MIQKQVPFLSRKNTRYLYRLASALCAAVYTLVLPFTQRVVSANQGPDEAENVQLVGHHDLQGREALQITARADDANGDWVYVGHLDNFWDGTERFNPITNQMEWNGTSIVDVSDPANPKLVWHIPNTESANSRSTSVVYDYGFRSNPPGRDYLIRNSQGEGFAKFQIFDITTRDTDPSQIHLVAEITGTPEGSCGPGCGGPLTAVHKGWWSPDTGLYYSAANEPGFRNGHHMVVFDLTDPTHPVLAGRAWLPGQKSTEPETANGNNWHHPIPDEENHRVYGAYLGGGDVVSFDVEDLSDPKLLWHTDTEPPGRGTHTVSPILYDEVPNFGPDALPRMYALVSDEATGPDIACANSVRTKVYMLDITHAEESGFAYPVDTWQVPNGDFCEKGGRFGPHQFAETVNGRLNRFPDKIAYVAYFNAGLRVLDISNPYNMTEVGYYIPSPNKNSHPIEPGQPSVIQINDVAVDRRGLLYASDRTGAGLFVLRYVKPD